MQPDSTNQRFSRGQLVRRETEDDDTPCYELVLEGGSGRNQFGVACLLDARFLADQFYGMHLLHIIDRKAREMGVRIDPPAGL